MKRSFEDYLKSAPQYNFDQYKSIVHTVTERFNEISSEVRYFYPISLFNVKSPDYQTYFILGGQQRL